jgi:hypothetical protein
MTKRSWLGQKALTIVVVVGDDSVPENTDTHNVRDKLIKPVSRSNVTPQYFSRSDCYEEMARQSPSLQASVRLTMIDMGVLHYYDVM